MNTTGKADCIVVENTNYAQQFSFENWECAKKSLRQKVSSPKNPKFSRFTVFCSYLNLLLVNRSFFYWVLKYSHWGSSCMELTLCILQHLMINKKVIYVVLVTTLLFKDLLQHRPEKNFCHSNALELVHIYNKKYSLVLANKIDSPREYF